MIETDLSRGRKVNCVADVRYKVRKVSGNGGTDVSKLN
jgi:hypothetical protein